MTAGHRLMLIEDELPPGYAAPVPLPPLARAVYVVAGSLRLGKHRLGADDGTIAVDAAPLASATGARLWRWELLPAGVEPVLLADRSRPRLSAALDTAPAGEPWLLRLDSVAFPPGGCAYRHVHQGPGIRCLLSGAIRIDAEGLSSWLQPGQAWFEAGPSPVFAQAADVATRFVRVMVLPQRLLGQSSIRYVDPADRDKPKRQRYRVYADVPLAG